MTKLLVDKSRLWKSKSLFPIPPHLSLLARLLEMKDDSGKTALLIACQKKDSSLIELLVQAGADINAIDHDGNSAVLLAASSLEKDTIPSKDLSPFIFKVRIPFHSILFFVE